MEGVPKCISESGGPIKVGLPGCSRYRTMVSASGTYRGIYGDVYVNLGVNHEALVPLGRELFVIVLWRMETRNCRLEGGLYG